MAEPQHVFWPIDPKLITEEAGTRGGQHWGMDFGIPVGTSVIAPFDGVVVWTGNDGAEGYYAPANVWANGPALIMDIQRDDGLISRFAHLSEFTARQGQRVRAGDMVAKSGNSGFTSGPHLHWEIRHNRALSANGWVNPREFDPQVFKNATPRKDKPMAALIRNYDGSIGLVDDAGLLYPISSMREVDSLKMTGLVGDWVQMPDGTVWNALGARTARVKAQDAGVDEKALAAELAPLLVSPVVESLRGIAGLTQDQVEAAVASAVKGILTKAAQ